MFPLRPYFTTMAWALVTSAATWMLAGGVTVVDHPVIKGCMIGLAVVMVFICFFGTGYLLIHKAEEAEKAERNRK